MMTHFITYSDENYAEKQKNLNARASESFDRVHSYNKEWLIKTDFYTENEEILSESRGGGYWLWKPYIILETLNKINDGDVVFYLDSGDVFYGDLSGFIKDYFKTNETLLTFGGHPQKDWTKRDCFILMDCDNDVYYNQIQIEAGILSFKKTDRVMYIIREWLDYCKNKHILTDIENIKGENLNGFKDHRHDQSVMTNLAIKYNLNVNRLLRKYIICNAN